MHFGGDGGEAFVARHAEHRFGVHDGDPRPSVGLVDHDVAGKEQTEVRLHGERRMRELGIAGAEDDVRTAVHAELVLHRLLDVDLGDDAEALGFEGLEDARQDRVV